MQKKLALSIALMVMLPILLLGWFGLRTMRQEQAAVAHRMQTLVMAQLKSVDETIQRLFLERQNIFLHDATNLSATLNTETIRDYVQNSLYIQNIFRMDGKGQRLFPPVDQPLSEAEQRFLQRTASIWENPQRLTQSIPISVLSTTNTVRDNLTSEAHPNQFGWYAWYWDTELHQLFWVRTAEQHILGFELDSTRFASDLIAALPASGNSQDMADNTLIRLRDTNGTIVYQWGAYLPPDTEMSVATLPLSPPLGSWKVEYYRDAKQLLGRTGFFALGSGMLAVVNVLIGLGYYLYREQSREMRLAAQRVNFVNQVSHELKTPLTNIRLYAELLDDELAEEEDKAHSYLNIITLESQRLSRLITNVLSFARAQRDHLQLQFTPAVVDDIVRRCLEAFQPAFDAHSMKIEWEANAHKSVMLDAEALEQILNNLLSNVEKYGTSGKRLDIESHQEDGRTHITLRDYGSGIPTDEHERIFQPFYRISSKLTDGVTGTGIGLSIARELARLHGGDVVLKRVERGACFEVSLTTPDARETS